MPLAQWQDLSDAFYFFLPFSSAGEPLSNQDLVGWVQLGVQHVPRSEDIPVGESSTG